MQVTPWHSPHAGHRVPVLARSVVVAAQPLAAQAGLTMLAQGGSAADAVIAAAATSMVVEPTSSGLGADAFALVDDGEVRALNASGRTPWRPWPDLIGKPVPMMGWPSVTVPGAVAGWTALWKRHGQLPFAQLLQPAIGYAEQGFLVSPLVSRVWRGLAASSRTFPELRRVFFADRRGPDVGELVRLPDLAQSLRLLAASAGHDLYEGELAQRIVAHSRDSGGLLEARDLTGPHADWMTPLSVSFAGHRLYEAPPNSQGIAALIALGILARLGLGPGDMGQVDAVHLQVEAMRLALAQAWREVADPEAMRMPAQRLLAPRRLDRLARLVRSGRARQGAPVRAPRAGGTSYIAAADARGLMVSYIQSSGPGFGSGIVVPGTGIALQNRASAFHPDPRHPNAYAPGKRPLHSNCPALLKQEAGGSQRLAFGLMGWSMQPQAHLQFACHALLGGEKAQAVLDAPRWRLAAEEDGLLLEPELAARLGPALAERGHRIIATERFLPAATPFGSHLMFGGGGLIASLVDGYAAAADGRRDGAAVGM